MTKSIVAIGLALTVATAAGHALAFNPRPVPPLKAPGFGPHGPNRIHPRGGGHHRSAGAAAGHQTVTPLEVSTGHTSGQRLH